MRRYHLWIPAVLLAALCASPAFAASAYEKITDDEIAKLTYEDVEEDNGFVCPWAPELTHLDDERKQRLEDWARKLSDWDPGKVEDIGQLVKNYCCLMSLIDIVHGEWEGEAPVKIYEKLTLEIPVDKLKKAAAWVHLKPDEGEIISKISDLDIDADVDKDFVKERATLYGKKILGRLMNKLPIKYDDKGNRIEPGQAAKEPEKEAAKEATAATPPELKKESTK
jgi:hypothetical protein